METTFSEYLKTAPTKIEINYWDLPKNACINFYSIPKNVKMRGSTITTRRLIEQIKKDSKINKQIESVLFLRNSRRLSLKLPLSLDTIDFVNLHSLMVSEGSHKSEFRIHVPERFFHDIFVKSLSNIFGEEIKKLIIQKRERNILRSTAPAIIRNIIPINEYIPQIILKNKEYCRRYLQISFEAEGSPILVGSKRYISLKRNTSIDDVIKTKLNYLEEKRIYIKKFAEDYPSLINIVQSHPPKSLLGEHLILKEYFDIDSIINPEAIRINKTNHRCGGKIAVRWALYIYADSINKFIKEIDFISKNKKIKTKEMLKIKGNKRQYFSLDIMKNISENKIFKTSDFVIEMKKLGYVSPQKFLWDYWKNKKIIKRIGRGTYKLLID